MITFNNLVLLWAAFSGVFTLVAFGVIKLNYGPHTKITGASIAVIASFFAVAVAIILCLIYIETSIN